MRKGGVLERFPVYLFCSDGCDDPILINDSPELGRLNLSTVPGKCRLTIAVSSNKELLEETRETYHGLENNEMHLVQANPEKYPFRHTSIGTIVNLASNGRIEELEFSDKQKILALRTEFNRILVQEGCLIESETEHVDDTHAKNHETDRLTEVRSYFIRPPSGDQYIITKNGASVPNSLEIFHHSRLQPIRARANALLRHRSISSFNDGVGITVSSSVPNRTIVESLARMIQGIENDSPSHLPDANGFSLFVKSDWNAFLLTGYLENTISKLPLCNKVFAKMEHNADTISVLERELVPALHSVLPKVVSKGVICGQAYWIEKKIEGIPATKIWWKPIPRRRAAMSSLHFLVDLHTSTARPARISQQLFNTLVGSDIELVEKRVKNCDPGFNLGALRDRLWSIFQERNIQLVRTHGDMWQGNLLVNEDEELVGVLDWDLSKKEGWPVIDLLHLLAFQYKWLAVWHFGRLITWKFLPRHLTRQERQMTAKYYADLSIEDELWPGFVALYWLHRAAQGVGFFDNSWFRRNVIKPLPNIIKATSRV